MRLQTRDLFATIRTEGGLLPPDLLQRVADGDAELDGLDSASYHLPPNERLNEAITRSWARLQGAWKAFAHARAALPPDDRGASLTRERWLHPLFDELGYGRLVAQPAVEIEGKRYPIFSQWQHTPIHLVGLNVPIDRRTKGVSGAAGQSPHSLLQEFLNRSPDRLWGIVSNGLALRLLRDNVALTRQAFVEFDLEAMMENEAYADFVVLWLTCHQSRVEGEDPEQCRLELWSREVAALGTRALDLLRGGVEAAIEALGSGFLVHRANGDLQEALRDGSLSRDDYYHHVLRLVYRLLFLMVAEDRGALLVGEDRAARETYSTHYSTARLRRLAARRRGGTHDDLYAALSLIMDKLHEKGCDPLALPALGSELWDPRSVGFLATARISNEALLDAVRELAFVEEGGVRRSVDFRNLGAEELGSVYESLLELRPEVDREAGHLALLGESSNSSGSSGKSAKKAGGSTRRTTGSYYTPTSLISVLLDSALDPVLADAVAGKSSEEAEAALLDLKVCDPACGSGHFLIAAANRIARQLAGVRTGEFEPSPEALQSARREVIERCVFGVDMNPMAVELCKVSLWMETMVPGRPLSFLDAHVRLGNSLLGTTVELVEQGIPDGAYKALRRGDDRDVVKSLRKENAAARKGQLTTGEAITGLAAELTGAAAASEPENVSESLTEVRERERRQQEMEGSALARSLHAAADAWTAAFIAPKTPDAARFTTGTVRRIAAGGAPEEAEAAGRAVAAFRPFHWELEFPSVFGEGGGFDAILGNPPWGRVKLEDQRFFAVSAPEVAAAPNKAARDKMIAALEHVDKALFDAYQEELRRFEALSLLLHKNGRYPLTGVGDVNTYALFAELSRSLLAPGGRAGMIVQSGIVTDDTTKAFFADLVDSRSLVAVYGFENEDKVFPAVHNQTKFCLLSLSSPGAGPEEFELSFFNRSAATVKDPDRLFRLDAKDVATINPNSRTCPVFRSSRDAEIMREIHSRLGVLIEDGEPERNPWGVSFQRMFDMANDSGLFRSPANLEVEGWSCAGEVFSKGTERCLPLLEGKMTWLWNPRFGTYEGQTEAQANKGVLPRATEADLGDPRYVNRPRYWVDGFRVKEAWGGSRDWCIACRDIGPKERTFVVSAVPRWATGDSLALIHVSDRVSAPLSLMATLSSFVVDYSARVRAANGRMKYFVIRQLPVPGPDVFEARASWDSNATLDDWLQPRALELIYTANLLGPLAADCGYEGQPFRWDPNRRELLMAEIDAAIFHVYGLSRSQCVHVLDSFELVREHDEEAHGEYRTKRLILEIYDELAEAIASSVAYRTRLDPPPGDAAAAHAG